MEPSETVEATGAESRRSLSISLPSLFGIPFTIHWSWWFAIVPSALEGPKNLGYLLSLYFFVLLHELGHAYAAHKFGFKTYGITLTMLGGLAQIDFSRMRPIQELVVALAGPFVNVLLIVLFLGVGHYWAGTEVERCLSMLAFANLVIILFNLLPMFPMDGGRVFRSVLNGALEDTLRATWVAVRIGQVFAVLMGAFAISHGIFAAALIGVLMSVAAEYELNMVRNDNLEYEQESEAGEIGEETA